MCYAEFASTVPVAGSAYTFSYATLGELVAWIIGWDLVLEFTIGAAVVATGFSGYFLGVDRGHAVRRIAAAAVGSARHVVDLPAQCVIIAVVTGVLMLGIKLSARTNR